MKKFDIEKIEKIFKSRFFTSQTAGIYGGVAGLYDLGPVLVGIKQSLVNEWRKFFILEENLLEVESSVLLPYSVLKASGHVDRFCDILICDSVNQSSYRADHYITSVLEKMEQTNEVIQYLKNVDCMSCEEIDAIINKYDIRSPDNNLFSKSVKFNLMFETSIGYKSGSSVFLRPETAQGQFLNFKKLYEFNNKKIPFGSASIGKAFRNEISPRSGLLRVREFEQAEIEYFVDPNDKKNAKFKDVQDLSIKLCYNDIESYMTLKLAVENSIIDNETLGYFIGRTYMFLLKIGVDKKLIRFRQHKKDEMAHYAKDCWDAELYSSYGWIECVGIADRSAYDLSCHSKASGVDLFFSKKLSNPKEVQEWVVQVDKKKYGSMLKNKFGEFSKNLEKLTNEEIEHKKVSREGKYFVDFEFENNSYEIECNYETRKIYEESFIPDVIEPSFGIGRILYILLEHSFYVRDNGREVFRLLPSMSGVKCVITCLDDISAHAEDIKTIRSCLLDSNIMVEINTRSCSIGKKYASCDELGIPFFITFDSDTKTDHKVTLRERDSMEQIRIDIDQVPELVISIVNSKTTWIKLRDLFKSSLIIK